MFTRVVEVITKPGKSHELASTIHEKIIPILRQQSGFLDEMVLTSDMEPNLIMAISYWKNKDDAERYERENFGKVTEILSNFLETKPVVRTFNVHTSTLHKIAVERAA